jgi:uncharacterized protein (TIGR00661 family)
MKIFYAVQGTGNGHISRAMELLPHLEKYGQVDIFLSGDNNTLDLNAPVAFRSKGACLYYTCHGGLHYAKTLTTLSLRRIHKEAGDLPLEKYDLILNDFEAITSLACRKKNLPSVHFGHQASFVTPKTPRPEKKSLTGEWILRNYAKGTINVGLHFDAFDYFIQPPVIKSGIWIARPTDKGHISVYLPSYCNKTLIGIFSKIKGVRFEIFSRRSSAISRNGNITLLPVDKDAFNKSLISCHGIITGAGFETPAEALYLKKKILPIPIRGQYEQECNAAALKKMGIKTLSKIDDHFEREVEQWLAAPVPAVAAWFRPASQIVEALMEASFPVIRRRKAGPECLC